MNQNTQRPIQSLADFVTESMAQKPYRQRVEVVIWKDGLVLVTINKHADGTVWHGLPGGGVDNGELVHEAVRRETKQEVGVDIKNLSSTGLMSRKEGYQSPIVEREEKYAGSITVLLEADYLGEDHSLLNQENDAVDYQFMHPTDALHLFRDHMLKSQGGSGNHAIQYLGNLTVRDLMRKTYQNNPGTPGYIEYNY